MAPSRDCQTPAAAHCYCGEAHRQDCVQGSTLLANCLRLLESYGLNGRSIV